MTIVAGNDGFSGQRRDGSVREADFVVALNPDGTKIGAAQGGTGPAKLEDDPHASGDMGTFILGVRNDTLSTTFSGANGDYTPIAVGSNGGILLGNGTHGPAKAEDAASATTDVGIFVLGVRRDTLATSTSASGDYSEMALSAQGQTLNKPYADASADWQYAAAASGIVNTTTAVTFKAAAGASIRNYITGIDLSTDGALGAATEIAIRDGAAGTVIWRMKVGTAGIQGGRSIQFPTPLKGTANTLLEVVTLTASVTGAVYFNAQGYVGP